jgi:hypothetical protein
MLEDSLTWPQSAGGQQGQGIDCRLQSEGNNKKEEWGSCSRDLYQRFSVKLHVVLIFICWVKQLKTGTADISRNYPSESHFKCFLLVSSK